MKMTKISKKGLLFVLIMIIGVLCFAYVHDLLVVGVSIAGGLIISFIFFYAVKFRFYVLDRFANEW